MPHPARVYVDESYGDNNSFMVQTAIALPAGNTEEAFNASLEAKFSENAAFDRDEFKANKLNGKNRFIYQWFLQQVINIAAEIADRTPCRSLITIDSMEKYRNEVYQQLYNQLHGALGSIGYPGAEANNARDFIRQVIWLHARLPRLIPPEGTGDVELYFDEKYRMDLSFQEEVAAWVPRNGARVRFQEERWRAYSRLLRILLEVLPTTRQFPRVASFTYANSKSNYLLQAADLLSNLTLNAIKFRMGEVNDRTRLKYEMLCSVMDRDPIPDELLAEFVVVDGRVVCRNPELFSSIELGT